MSKDYKKLYEEALSRARDLHDNHPLGQPQTWMTCERIFPELKESEDERIRKEILELVRQSSEVLNKKNQERMIAWLEKQATPQIRTGLEWVTTIDDACNKRYAEEYAHGEYCHEQSFKWGFQEGVEWLEKQGEQKPVSTEETELNSLAFLTELGYTCIPPKKENQMMDLWEYIKEFKDKFGRLPKDEDELAVCIDYVMKRKKSTWSEEDEEWVIFFEKLLEFAYNKDPHGLGTMCIGGKVWLKSLKDRVQFQPKQEWSECDKRILNSMICYFNEMCNKCNTQLDFMCYSERLDWLKSLKPCWKPTDEQMEALERECYSHHNYQLCRLLENLKNL